MFNVVTATAFRQTYSTHMSVYILLKLCLLSNKRKFVNIDNERQRGGGGTVDNEQEGATYAAQARI